MFRINRGFIIIICLMVGLMCHPALAGQKPIQLALFSPVQIVSEHNAVAGVRLSLIYGKNTRVTGLDYGFVSLATEGVSAGVQFGVVGIVKADFTGWQNSAVNIVDRNFEGFQWGLVNYADRASGFQFGLVNYARTMRGLQIGLVNIIKQGGQFPFFPIINWSF